MDRSNVIVVTPTAPVSASLAIAASRAGGVGILNLEWASEGAGVRALNEAGRARPETFGVLLGADAVTWLERIRAAGDSFVSVVVLTDGQSDTVAAAALARQMGCRVLLQVVSTSSRQLARECQVDGVILKGHEAGGRIGNETSFVLLQRWMRESLGDDAAELPVWVQGGIGVHTAAACQAGGARGVVLDSQLLLTRESPLEAPLRNWIAALDGGETRVVGQELQAPLRCVASPGSKVIERLQAASLRLALSEAPNRFETWRAAVADALSNGAALWGQDIAHAASLAEAHLTTGGVITAVAETSEESLASAAEHQPLAPGAPMAVSHGTKYPLLQGPMTRVSDVAPFAEAVAEGGGLPFLALALLRGPQVEPLIKETASRLGDRSWGVGILGFLPPEIRAEQVEVILRYKPPFALIAGGRPDQAAALEEAGIPTYLHVPSPGLLKMFLKDGAHRFVFEGRECGGHVGPRSSFVLWETMCRELLGHLGASGRGEKLHVVFAGGVHDAMSAAMVAAMAAPLAARGVKVGALMGTAYLFTREAVESGAIVPRFQQEALKTADTVLMETGPGHAIRCVRTPYFEVFEQEKNRLKAEGKTHDEIVRTLEWMNIGRLRVASKGVDRVEQDGRRKLQGVSDQEQYDRGMYMIGQVAALHDEVIGVAELHADVSEGGARRLRKLTEVRVDVKPTPQPCDVAIIGMSSFYPGSLGLEEYWENILNKVCAIREIPLSHWDWRMYYDENPLARDKIASKWGGFLDDVPFDPFRYGITPKSITSIEPLQLLLLECVRLGLQDAGYEKRDWNRENTCAVLGIGGGGSPLAMLYGLRSCLPLIDTMPGLPITSNEILEQAGDLLPEWTEDSFPGFLFNVAVGRVANRFNLGGSNFAVDAACASSLAAVHACLRELEMGTADMAIAMGADTVQTAYSYMAFSKTHALSVKGRSRPFDEEADGIVLSEGVGVAVLKRLADAERDGDTIYAVIRGVGASSDGKEKGLTAPNSTGQMRALRRAYEKAGISPAKVGLVEAHGTGTVVGDKTEAESLTRVMAESGAELSSCALGSVKSMIGHSKCAAGIAGLIKAAKALHHKTLPPTLVETPNRRAEFDKGALYLNTEPRPWIQATGEPRVAGVSAFGFGGTNVHVAVEEYIDGYLAPPPPARRTWPTELLLWRAADRAALRKSVEQCRAKLAAGARPKLHELAASLWKACPPRGETPLPTLAVVVESLEDAVAKLAAAVKLLDGDDPEVRDPRGIFFQNRPDPGKVAFLFPGQGSQYPDMLAELALNFHEVRESFDDATRWLGDRLPGGRPLGHFLYPPSPFSDAQREQNQQTLSQTDVAQPAIGAASLGILRLLRQLGIVPDCLGGHSYGELTALCAAGAMAPETLIALSHRRGELMRDAGGAESGGMAAVAADQEAVAALIDGVDQVWLANLNSPRQTVISGADAALETVAARAQAAGLRAQRLPVACGFHSPLVAAAAAPFARELAAADLGPPRIAVYSNITASPYADQSGAVLEQLQTHLSSPVRFRDEIEAMYRDGVRTFVEVGPQQVLSGLVKGILGERPHIAASADSKSRHGLTQLAHLLGQLWAAGVDCQLTPLYERRQLRTFDVAKLENETGVVQHSPSTWVINGTRNKPLAAPEPRFLGQAGLGEYLEQRDGKKSAGQAAAAKPPLNGQTPPQPRSRPSGAADAPPVTKGAAPVNAAGPRSAANGEHSPSAAPASPPPSGSRFAPPGAAAEKNSPKRSVPPVRSPQSSSSNMISMNQNSESSRIADADAAQVMLGFQDVMQRFLDTQRAVMLSYLGAAVEDPPPALEAPSRLAKIATRAPSAAGPSAPSAATTVPAAAPAATPAAVPPAPASKNGQNDAVGANAVGANAVSARPAGAPGGASQAPATAGSATEANRDSGSNGQASPSPTPSSSPSVGSAAESAPQTLEEITEQLMDLVSERTGYPKEMLDLDLDLEADLGIDSIKRVEILGGLAQSLGAVEGEESELSNKLELEKLTTIRTLRGILDYLDNALFGEGAEAASASSATTATTATTAEKSAASTSAPGRVESNGQAGKNRLDDASPEVDLTIYRGLVELVEAPLAAGSAIVPQGPVLVTDDGRGVAAEVAERLSDFGTPVILLRPSDGGEPKWDDDVCVADLNDPASVAQVVERVRSEHGRPAGVIHLLPLSLERSSIRDRQADVRTLYLLARAVESDLNAEAERGSAFLLAATGLGGSLGFGEKSLPDRATACHGGVLGLLKCVSQEWPDVVVRAVDFDLDAEPSEVAERLLSELGDREGPSEVGWEGDVRQTWAPVQGELSKESESDLLAPGSTLLVTGGARGITSVIALRLAERCQPHLVVVGRSPLPEGEEPSATASLSSPAELKAELIRRRKAQQQDASPAAVEAEYQELLRNREIRSNLAALRAAGASVEYHALDVRNRESLRRLLDDVVGRRGAIDGVIHGAGVIEDKLLRDKTPESYDRVLSTKVDSAFALAETLDPQTVKFCVFFSSIAGRYGNRGQSDYAAANEAMAKLGAQLNREWPGRVLSVDWGPWSGLGMVADLEKHMVARGVAMVSPEIGAAMLIEELLYGPPADSEVMIAGGAGNLLKPRGTQSAATA